MDEIIGYLLLWYDRYYFFCLDCSKESGLWVGREGNKGVFAVFPDHIGPYKQTCCRDGCRWEVNTGVSELELFSWQVLRTLPMPSDVLRGQNG